MFACAGGLLATGMAVAIEVAGMTSMRQDIQTNFDMAALSAVVQVSTDKSLLNGERDENSLNQDYKDAFIGALDANGFDLGGASPNMSIKGGALIAEASVPYEFRFGGVINKKSTSIDVLSKVSLPEGGAPVEIALVLDNTDSMNIDGKLGALQTGATNFISAVEESGSGSKIALVPFARYVKIDDDFRGAPWLEIPEEFDTPRTWTQATHTGGTCEDVEKTRWRDGFEETYTTTECTGQTTTYEEQHTTTESRWTGCIGIRADDLHMEDGPYTTTATKVQGLLNKQPREKTGLSRDVGVSCPQALTPLTDDYSALRGKISSLYAVDTTYIPMGLNWGRRILSSEDPFAETDTVEPKKKIMVLMTDGANTARINKGAMAEANYNAPPYIYEFTNMQQEAGKVPEQANGDTLALCETIKAEGTELYTIAFQVSDSLTLELLENCASSGRHYYNSNSNEELVETFASIASGLGGDIRIMQ